MDHEVTIRRAETLADYRACQAAQRTAWGITEEGYVLPIATMVGAQLHGGLVLGAFLPNGEAVGLSFAFLGRVEGRLGLYSQLTGVVPGYQDRGIGGRLKLAQRDVARAEGLALIAWAFDPLQAGNARFNLDKLGATAGRYVEDMYGPRTDALNAGTPTDRLIVAWEIEPTPRPTIAVEDAKNLPRLIVAETRPDGRRIVATTNPAPAGPWALLEVPADINRLRALDAALADLWRLAVRQAFQAAFAAGYRAVGFLRFEDEGQPCGFYLLHRDLNGQKNLATKVNAIEVRKGWQSDEAQAVCAEAVARFLDFPITPADHQHEWEVRLALAEQQLRRHRPAGADVRPARPGRLHPRRRLPARPDGPGINPGQVGHHARAWFVVDPLRRA